MADDDSKGPGRKIGVFYLHRRGNRKTLLRTFLASLKGNPTNLDFSLFIICKGFEEASLEKKTSSWSKYLKQPVNLIYVGDEGFDLTAYRTAAARTDVDYCLFFNSYAVILAPRWLETYAACVPLLGENFLVGATGSYARWGLDEPFENVGEPFERAHIRTNAFFIPRKLYLSFDEPFSTKMDCYMFESGPDNISQRILRSGGFIALVDRQGRIILPGDWPDSRTFFSGRQENLLVADNHTHYYQTSKVRRRKRLSSGVWGRDRGNAEADSWLARKLWKLSREYGVGTGP